MGTVDDGAGTGERFERTGGPLSYQNWIAARARLPWLYVQEFPLFTDAHITGQLSDQCGPYEFLNPIASSEHGETVIGVVLRAAMHLDPRLRPEFPKRTEEDAYHGGGFTDELAALLSLCLGVRLRSGRATRIFRPEGDPKGSPHAFDMASIPAVGRRSRRMVIPAAAGPANLNERTGPLARYPDLAATDATVLVKVARSYQEAMWLAEIQPEVTWLMLAQAVETAANHWAKDEATPLQLVEDWGPGLELLTCLRGLGLSEDSLQGPVSILARYVGARRKFRKFLLHFLPAPPSARPPETARIDWGTDVMARIFDRVYECRSKAVHNGQPFPSVMSDAPILLDGVLAERPLGSAAMVYGAFWKEKDMPILLHTFEYIVRRALLGWWESMLPAVGVGRVENQPVEGGK